MTAGRQARRAADVGSGSSVEIAISHDSISLHSMTSGARPFNRTLAGALHELARTPNGGVYRMLRMQRCAA
jgi:hypothetical protein